jgi:hypothetical protein
VSDDQNAYFIVLHPIKKNAVLKEKKNIWMSWGKENDLSPVFIAIWGQISSRLGQQMN